MQFLISNRVNAIDTHKKRTHGIDERETGPVKLLIADGQMRTNTKSCGSIWGIRCCLKYINTLIYSPRSCR